MLRCDILNLFTYKDRDVQPLHVSVSFILFLPVLAIVICSFSISSTTLMVL